MDVMEKIPVLCFHTAAPISSLQTNFNIKPHRPGFSTLEPMYIVKHVGAWGCMGCMRGAWHPVCCTELQGDAA